MKSVILSTFFLLFVGISSLQAQKQYPDSTIMNNVLQKRGEIIFKFKFTDKSQLEKISHFVSIDKVKNDTAVVYANKSGYLRFRKLGIPFSLLVPPSKRLPKDKLRNLKNSSTDKWNFYPSYPEYVSIMENFQKNFPNLCKIVSIGQSVQGRKLLFAHIYHVQDTMDSLPQFMYTSTMHGDETTGYILSLHLIDYLLKNYGKDSLSTHLIDSLDIWINPLANPDGTYAAGNSSVYGATRFNANHIDLNRNYPDPRAGQHPDGNQWQPETKAFMQFAEKHHFVLSCNMHTGSEVANYPWDTWEIRTADDTWWQEVCRQYADTVHAYAPEGYFTDLNNGITDGYDWYSITGGRQDYMNYFQHDREFTLELSDTKMPAPSTLPDYWEYNYRSLLDYMHQTLKGIRGKITDSLTGKPIFAEIFVLHHDTLHSEAFSDSLTGKYFRPILPGKYTIRFSAPGYHSKLIPLLEIPYNKPVIYNVKLISDSVNSTPFYKASTISFYPNPTSYYLHSSIFIPGSYLKIINIEGEIVFQQKIKKKIIDIHYLPSGFYFAEIINRGKIYSGKFFKR